MCGDFGKGEENEHEVRNKIPHRRGLGYICSKGRACFAPDLRQELRHIWSFKVAKAVPIQRPKSRNLLLR